MEQLYEGGDGAKSCVVLLLGRTGRVEGMQVYDIGAYPEALLTGGINAQAAVEKMWDMIDRLNKKRSQLDGEE